MAEGSSRPLLVILDRASSCGLRVIRMPVSCCWNPAQYSSLAAESRAATGRALKLSEALSSPLKPSSCSWSRECVGCAGGYFLHLKESQVVGNSRYQKTGG
jgi:hypothetical protein